MTGRNPARYRVYGCIATLAGAVAILIGIWCESAAATSAWMAVACLSILTQQASFWSVTTEIGGAHLGVLFGLMNSMGVPGAFLSSKFVGQSAEWMAESGSQGRAQWDPAFYVSAGVLVVGAVLAVRRRRAKNRGRGRGRAQ